MKKTLTLTLAMLSMMLLLSGCAVNLGPSARTVVRNPTVGQQLVDLQKARDSGAITDSEYQDQKAKLLATKYEPV